ncbi:hypothetical protein [Chryseobacterium sp.]|uniref:hypothetical protein n=1 Tax=Chryseobacterium sp. TaxID=1871047 RepID=UPI002899F082|nr:hypothetical protein [Chryseobacterium sp.]
MHNIQDLKDRIFSESKNIISILGKIEHVNELAEKQDLVNELAEKISFLKLLNQKIEYYTTEFSAAVTSEEVVEEEAIFNNELNQIGDNYPEVDDEISIAEEEEIFDDQIVDIIENDFHESMVSLAEENQPEADVNFVSDEINDHLELEEEAVFNNHLNEIEEEEESQNRVLSFVDEERILANSEPENDEDFEEEIDQQNSTEEEKIFEDELSEIDDEIVQEEKIPTIFDAEHPAEEILVEENESLYKNSFEEGEMMSETSNVDQIIAEIKNDKPEESSETETVNEERGKIVDFEEKNVEENQEHASDRSFEDLEKYRQEKKIKLAHIRGLKTIQSLFDDDPLERETVPSAEIVDIPVKNEESGSILKTNVPTDFMEAEKEKLQFKLDLNDRIAFSKTLFGGSQSELNEVVNNLNSFKNVEDAKEYLSDLYYAKKWDKVDEYAQRLWILVENKFL